MTSIIIILRWQQDDRYTAAAAVVPIQMQRFSGRKWIGGGGGGGDANCFVPTFRSHWLFVMFNLVVKFHEKYIRKFIRIYSSQHLCRQSPVKKMLCVLPFAFIREYDQSQGQFCLCCVNHTQIVWHNANVFTLNCSINKIICKYERERANFSIICCIAKSETSEKKNGSLKQERRRKRELHKTSISQQAKNIQWNGMLRAHNGQTKKTFDFDYHKYVECTGAGGGFSSLFTQTKANI